ncbi:MAG: Transketolase 2 [Candidatus Dependentiae bacterium ADurb.Bin331]|nr:MAG: Transketolase 2 [Candidatus Dependentiae bacterium ADurb.Bin331]
MSQQVDYKTFLEQIAYRLRVDSLESTTAAGSGHPTSCLSAADIVAVLFFFAMHFDPNNPDNPNNDRFILSKGHAAPLLYSVWKELGIVSEKELLTLRQFDSELEGHPTPRFSRAEAATGSLGQGLSIGAGMALRAKRTHHEFKTFVLMGDAETSEGSVWEAAELAAFYQLNNLIGIIDINRLGQSTPTMEEYDIDDYQAKWRAFGWDAHTVNGHSIEELMKLFDAIKSPTKPTMILAKTIKGFGAPLAQNKEGFHGRAFKKEELPEIMQHMQKTFPTAAKPITFKWQPLVPKQKETEKKQITSISLAKPDYVRGQKIATRKAFGQALAAAGKQNKHIMSFDAEVKNSTFAEIFEHEFPDRFVQCFVAEQNMIGMAIGAQKRGAIPFASTFGAFFTRAFDQIRMAAIGRCPLRLVGSHAGVSIGQDGPSQMALEDIAIMRTLPESIVLYPCDAVSTYKLVELMTNHHDSISYLRTTRAETPVIYSIDEKFTIGGCKIVRSSSKDEVCIIAAGITLFEALKAHESLVKKDIFVSIIDLYSIKPLDETMLKKIGNASQKKIVTVEDHYLQGGLGEAVCAALRNEKFEIVCLAVKKLPRSGSPDELMNYEEIDSSAIINAVMKLR